MLHMVDDILCRVNSETFTDASLSNQTLAMSLICNNPMQPISGPQETYIGKHISGKTFTGRTETCQEQVCDLKYNF